jgi:hypothetical protein
MKLLEADEVEVDERRFKSMEIDELSEPFVCHSNY